MKPIQNNERYTLSKIISNDLRDFIINNHLKTGDRLPSERDLAEKMNVSRVIIREALRSLEATGIVTIKHGDGAYVNTDDPSVIFDHLLYFWKIKNEDTKELMELSCLLVKSAVDHIIAYPEKNCLDTLEDLYQKMEQTDDPDQFNQFKIEFHKTLISATNNKLYSQLIDVIFQYFQDLPADILKETDKNKAIKEHQTILQAIKDGNKEEALYIVNTMYNNNRQLKKNTN